MKNDSIVLVTGASRGLGRGIARAFGSTGATVYVTGRHAAELEGVVTEINAVGGKSVAIVCDHQADDQVAALFHRIAKEAGRLDILVNNAGTILRNPAAEHSDEFWDEVLEVNLSSQFILSREIGARMIAEGSGKIIFTASLLSFQGGINVPGYAASKGGIARLTMALANEWAGKGVNVNAIAPGYISTDNTTALREDKERSASILGRIPAGRWGEPEDFKGPVVFLASEASNYVHGTILTVDGGWMGR